MLVGEVRVRDQSGRAPSGRCRAAGSGPRRRRTCRSRPRSSGRRRAGRSRSAADSDGAPAGDRPAQGEGDPGRGGPEREERRGHEQGRRPERGHGRQGRRAPAIGLGAMSRRRTRAGAGRPPRAALAAVVSHSSSRRRVTPRRTSVMPIACTRSHASLAMKVSCRPSARRRGLADRRPSRARTDAHDWPRPRTAQRPRRPTRPRETRVAASATSGPDRRMPGQHRPPEHEQQQRRRRQQAAAQVVEDLPARDERQPVARQPGARRHERKQPPQDLPVAADPAVLPARVRQHAGRGSRPRPRCR